MSNSISLASSDLFAFAGKQVNELFATIARANKKNNPEDIVLPNNVDKITVDNEKPITNSVQTFSDEKWSYLGAQTLGFFMNKISGVDMALAKPYIRVRAIGPSIVELDSLIFDDLDPGRSPSGMGITNDSSGLVSDAQKLRLGGLGAEAYTLPVTLARVNNKLAGQQYRKKFAPPFSIKGMNIAITHAAAGTYFHEKIDLVITVHDKAALRELTPLFNPTYGTQFVIEYGWSYPPTKQNLTDFPFKEINANETMAGMAAWGRAGGENKRSYTCISDFINSLRRRVVCTLTGFDVSIKDNGIVEASLSLLPSGSYFIGQKMGILSIDFKNEMADVKRKLDELNKMANRLEDVPSFVKPRVEEIRGIRDKIQLLESPETPEKTSTKKDNVATILFDAKKKVDEAIASLFPRNAKQTSLARVVAGLIMLQQRVTKEVLAGEKDNTAAQYPQKDIADKIHVEYYTFNDLALAMQNKNIGEFSISKEQLQKDLFGLIKGTRDYDVKLSDVFETLLGYINNDKNENYFGGKKDFFDSTGNPKKNYSAFVMQHGGTFIPPDVRMYITTEAITDLENDTVKPNYKIIFYDSTADKTDAFSISKMLNLTKVIAGKDANKNENDAQTNLDIIKQLIVDENEVPYLLVGTERSMIKSIGISSTSDEQVGMLYFERGQGTNPNERTRMTGQENNPLPLQYTMFDVDMKTMGYPLLRPGMKLFLDAKTGTTIDSMYSVMEITHNIGMESFETSLKLFPVSGYSTYMNIATTVEDLSQDPMTVATLKSSEQDPSTETTVSAVVWNLMERIFNVDADMNRMMQLYWYRIRLSGLNTATAEAMAASIRDENLYAIMAILEYEMKLCGMGLESTLPTIGDAGIKAYAQTILSHIKDQNRYCNYSIYFAPFADADGYPANLKNVISWGNPNPPYRETGFAIPPSTWTDKSPSPTKPFAPDGDGYILSKKIIEKHYKPKWKDWTNIFTPAKNINKNESASSDVKSLAHDIIEQIKSTIPGTETPETLQVRAIDITGQKSPYRAAKLLSKITHRDLVEFLQKK